MNKLAIGICFLFVATTASAEYWVCQEGKNLKNVQGDCMSLGLCSDFNNKGLNPSCIEATKQEYVDAALPGKKLDKSVVTGNRIVDMTQAEKDAIAQAEANAQSQAEAARLLALDDSMTNVNVTGIQLQKIEAAIDNLGSINDVKKFLKRLVRYIAVQ